MSSWKVCLNFWMENMQYKNFSDALRLGDKVELNKNVYMYLQEKVGLTFTYDVCGTEVPEKTRQNMKVVET